MENERQAISNKFQEIPGPYRKAATEKALRVMDDTEKSDVDKKAEIEQIARNAKEIAALINEIISGRTRIAEEIKRNEGYLPALEKKAREEDVEAVKMQIYSAKKFIKKIDIKIDTIGRELNRDEAYKIIEEINDTLKRSMKTREITKSKRKEKRAMKSGEKTQRFVMTKKMLAKLAGLGIGATMIGAWGVHIANGIIFHFQKPDNQLINDSRSIGTESIVEGDDLKEAFAYLIEDWNDDGHYKNNSEREEEYLAFEREFTYTLDCVDTYIEYADGAKEGTLEPSEEKLYYQAASQIAEYDGAEGLGFDQTVIRLVKAKYANELEEAGIHVFDYNDCINMVRIEDREASDVSSIIVRPLGMDTLRIVNSDELFFYITDFGRMPAQAEEIVDLVERLEAPGELTVGDKAVTMEELKAWLKYDIVLTKEGEIVKFTLNDSKYIQGQQKEQEGEEQEYTSEDKSAGVTMENSNIQSLRNEDDGR